MQEFLTFNQVANLIANVGTERTVIVLGENGIGKTALFHALKAMPEFNNHHAVDPIDCTQLSDGSIWMPDINRETGVSRELPNERFGVSEANRRGVAGSRPVLLAFDEVLKSPQYIKNAIAPALYERRLGSYHFPDSSVVCGFSNLTTEGLGDSLLPHFRSRLIVVKMRKPNAKEWDVWAAKAGIEPSVRAFVTMHPDVMHSFMDYEPGGEYYQPGQGVEKLNPKIFNPRAEQDGFASPRTLHAASDVVRKSSTLDDATLEVALMGTVGRATASALMSFIRFERDIPAFDRVVHDPLGTPLADNPTAQIVQVMQFNSRSKTRDQAEAVVKYVARMSETMQAMFCNVTANSAKIATFCTVAEYVVMQAKHKIYI